MGSVSRTAFTLLVIICTIGGSLPVMAALRDYGIYLGSIGGSVSLRLDNRLRKYAGSKIESNELTSTTAISTGGFIWDPRFMTVDLSLQYTSSKSTANDAAYDFDENSIGFRFQSVLFPRWRYPYSPIRLSASKTTRTLDGDGGIGIDTDYTQASLNWGLVQKQLGRVRIRYSFTLEESAGLTEGTTGEARARDIVRNRLQTSASKTFLKGKWGETRSRYGYQFDSSDDRVSDESDVQHYFFINNNTKFGRKTDLTSNALFYQRYYEGRDDGVDDEYVFTSNSNLRVQESERFQHYYSLNLRSDNDSNDYFGTTGAIYSYPHDFDEYLKGTASAGVSARLGGGTDQESLTQLYANASGRLAYRRNYEVYRLNSYYNLLVRAPAWESGSNARRGPTEELRISQTISLGVSRPNDPLYSDTATIRAQYEMAEDDSYSYSADYSARSTYKISTKASSLISGSAIASQPSRGDFSVGLNSSALLRYRFGRKTRSSISARQRWRKQDSREFSLFGIKGLISGQLYRRFNVRYSSELEWTRRIEEIQYGDPSARDEIRGAAEISSSMGKLVTSFRYTYIQTDLGYDVFTDQSIMLEVKRFFGWRL